MSPVGDALDVPAVPVERLSQHDPDGLERTLEAFGAPGLQSVLEPCKLCQHECPHRMNPFTIQPPPPERIPSSNESPHRKFPLLCVQVLHLAQRIGVVVGWAAVHLVVNLDELKGVGVMGQIPQHLQDVEVEVAMGLLGVCGQCATPTQTSGKRASHFLGTSDMAWSASYTVGIWPTGDLVLMAWVMIYAAMEGIHCWGLLVCKPQSFHAGVAAICDASTPAAFMGDGQ